MRYAVQLDAHVNSYREELKRKESERIKGILQYLEEKRKYLSLNGHPVKRIHYSMKMVKPVISVPLIEQLISFDNKVEVYNAGVQLPPKYEVSEIPTSEHQIPEVNIPCSPVLTLNCFKYIPPQIEYDLMSLVETPPTEVSYTPNFPQINIIPIHQIGNSKYTISSFIPLLVKDVHLNSYSADRIYHYSELDFTPSLPRVNCLDVTKPCVNSVKFDYKYSSPEIDHKSFQLSAAMFSQLMVDNTQLSSSLRIKLNSYNIHIPEYNVDYKAPSVSLQRKEFPKPNLDFSEVLRKFEVALRANTSEEE